MYQFTICPIHGANIALIRRLSRNSPKSKLLAMFCHRLILINFFPIIAGDLGIGRERVITKAGLSAQDCLFMGKHCFTFYCDFREFVYWLIFQKHVSVPIYGQTLLYNFRRFGHWSRAGHHKSGSQCTRLSIHGQTLLYFLLWFQGIWELINISKSCLSSYWWTNIAL